MAALDEIYELILPQLAGAPPDIALRWAVVRAARRFCQESRALRMPVTADLVAGTAAYRLVPNWPVSDVDSMAEREAVDVIGVQAVEVDGRPYTARLPQTFSQLGDACGVFVVYEPDEIEIFPTPSESKSDGLAATVVLVPKIAATTLDRKLRVQYADQVGTGALALLKAMPNEAWTDPKGAADAEKSFGADIGIARARADMQALPHGFHVRAYS